MTTIVLGLGCPEKYGQLAVYRVISHLVVISSYFFLGLAGLPFSVTLLIFVGIVFVAARARLHFDPSNLNVIDKSDGILRVHGKFKETTISPSVPWELKSVSLESGALRLSLAREGASTTATVDTSSFREQRLLLLYEVLTAFLQHDVDAMKSAMATAGGSPGRIIGNLFLIKEPPGFTKLVFGSLAIAAVILYVAYNVFVK